ncbi:MAG TPA: hypothetical protein DCY30_09580 [Acidimicrobiaceae bacterium]|jgi:uncharacterized protein (TIGR03086 family)|nr:hypothetical protein [Acidimicrobiaceae bacterium]
MSPQHSYLPSSMLEQTASYNHARYGHTLKIFADVASRSKHDQQTCCEGWNVQDVLEHATMVMTMVDQVDVDDPNFSTESDPIALAAHYAQEIEDRWNEESLKKIVKTPFGEMSVDDFLGIIFIDTITHVWDIADASAIDHCIPQAMAEEAYDVMKPREAGLRGPGRFDPAIDIETDDSVERFIAFTGRSSVRND